MGFSKFSFLLGIRLVFIMLVLIAFSYLLITPGYHATTLLFAIILIGQTYETYKFIAKTNAEVTRFLDAARYADFNQNFNLDKLGAGFEELGTTFSDILHRFQDVRSNQEEELHHLKALLEHVPVPLMSLNSDGSIVLWNNSSRRLFGINKIVRSEDLNQFGNDFYNEVLKIQTGSRKLVNFIHDETEQQLSIAASHIILKGQKEKLISLQNIQSELDIAQLQAWQDLVRVLTHEIMNSITPVASLSKTTVDLVEDVVGKLKKHPHIVDELGDVKDAVGTIARRSDSLMQFVSSYRSLTRPAPATKKNIKIESLFSRLTSIATLNWNDLGIKLVTEITPKKLDLSADVDMIEQILINLLKNAEQALIEVKNAEVRLRARINQSGRIVIEVEDNGVGVPENIAKQIFVPFFTTKREGSGVGLALTRQVMIAHGGLVTLGKGKDGGAKFTLTF